MFLKFIEQDENFKVLIYKAILLQVETNYVGCSFKRETADAGNFIWGKNIINFPSTLGAVLISYSGKEETWIQPRRDPSLKEEN